MSEIDELSLLGYNDERAIKRLKHGNAARRCYNDYYNYSSQLCGKAFVLTLIILIPLTVFFILYLEWHSIFKGQGPKFTIPPDPFMPAGPERDLKLLLHPEDHVLREASLRHFSWNISKATRSPNGVRKDVFLINSTVNGYLAL